VEAWKGRPVKALRGRRSVRALREMERRSSKTSEYLLTLDGALEKETIEREVSVGGAWKAVLRFKDGVVGLRPRAHTDPPRLETSREDMKEE